MADINRKIDEILEDKLRTGEKVKTSDNFTAFLMKRVEEEHASAKEEVKKDRIAKYIVWGFIAATLAVVLLTAFAASSPDRETSSALRISPDLETSTTFFSDISYYIQDFASSLLGIFGLGLDMKTVFYFIGFIFLIGLYLLGDKLIIRSRLKSNQV